MAGKVGYDFAVRAFLTLSDGTTVDNEVLSPLLFLSALWVVQSSPIQSRPLLRLVAAATSSAPAAQAL